MGAIMFWSKKNSKTGKEKEQQQTGKDSTAGQEKKKSEEVGTSNSQRLREEALANARKAREAMGDEAIQKIAAAIRKKQQSESEQAKEKIAKVDPDRVLDELKWMLEDNKKK